jgi:hypothetical protein
MRRDEDFKKLSIELLDTIALTDPPSRPLFSKTLPKTCKMETRGYSEEKFTR